MEEERKRMAVAAEAIDCGMRRLGEEAREGISMSIWGPSPTGKPGWGRGRQDRHVRREGGREKQVAVSDARWTCFQWDLKVLVWEGKLAPPGRQAVSTVLLYCWEEGRQRDKLLFFGTEMFTLGNLKLLRGGRWKEYVLLWLH